MRNIALVMSVLLVSFCLADVKEDMAAAQKLAEAGKCEEALQQYQKILKANPEDSVNAPNILNAIGALHVRLKKQEEAIKAYEGVTKEFSANRTACLAACNALADLHIAQGNLVKAAEVLQAACLNSALSTYLATMLGRLTKVCQEIGDAKAAIDGFRQIIAASPANLTCVLPAQTEIVKTLLYAGKYQEALGEAKVCFNLCSNDSKACPVAMELVAQCLKARDGHLFTADAFYRSQKSGPHGADGKAGTPDDVKNPLADVTLYQDEARTKVYMAAMAKAEQGLEGFRTRGFLYLLLDKPGKALNEFRQAFERCDMTDAALSKAARDIVIAFNATEAYVLGAEPWLAYQKHGSAGPDGKNGTADDMADPLAKYVEKPKPAPAPKDEVEKKP